MKFLVAAALLLPIGLSFAEDVDPLTLKNRALTTYEQQKPAYVVKEEAKTAQIKMQSFDKATVGQTAFIFATEGGESIPRSAMVVILYRDAPCLLQITQASAMRSAETLYGRAMVPACWGRLVTPTRDEVVIVTKFGDTQTGSLINYAETTILGDGSAKYIGSAMTQEEFKKNVEDYHKAIR